MYVPRKEQLRVRIRDTPCQYPKTIKVTEGIYRDSGIPEAVEWNCLL